MLRAYWHQLRCQADVVKACLQYRGTPDPLKGRELAFGTAGGSACVIWLAFLKPMCGGDAPNKAVREEADLAVKAVFSSSAALCRGLLNGIVESLMTQAPTPR